MLGAAGVALGWPAADPIVGLLITVAILAVLRDAAREIYRRLMDAVDLSLVDRADVTLRATPGVRDVGDLRLRWIGHALRAEVEVVVDPHLPLLDAHHIPHDAEHRLLHAIPDSPPRSCTPTPTPTPPSRTSRSRTTADRARDGNRPQNECGLVHIYARVHRPVIGTVGCWMHVEATDDRSLTVLDVASGMRRSAPR